ncbi:MAG: hypothetical protein RSD47_01135 [Romboutsia sp.]
MGDINIKEIQYSNFGKSIYITNDIIEIVVPLDLGPRIIRYSFVNEDNMLFEDVDRLVTEDLSNYKQYTDNKWYLYGGHRLWMSPEYMPSSYYPENTSIRYEKVENGVKIIGNIEEYNNIQKIVTIVLDKNSSKVEICNEIINLDEREKTIAPWAITTLCKDGVSITPISNIKTDFTPNKVIAYWAYTKLDDKRMEFVDDKYLKITQDTKNNQAFKIGLNNTDRWSAHCVGENVFLKTFDDVYTQVEDYSDYGVNFEIYTKELFLELESLGKLKTIGKNEKVVLNEKWYLMKNNSNNIINKVENELKNIEN